MSANEAGGSAGYQNSNKKETNQFDPWTDWTRGNAAAWVGNPGNIPNFWSGTGMDQPDALGSLDLGQLNDIIGSLRGFGTDLTGAENSALGTFGKSTDLNAIKAAQKENFDFLGVPQLQNSLAASNMGRSGAEAEQIAKAGVAASLPITQLANQRQAEMGQLQAMLASNAGNRGLKSMEDAGQLSLGGAGLQNQRDIAGLNSQTNTFQALLGNRGQMFTNLLRLLMPLITGQNTKESGFKVGATSDVGYYPSTNTPSTLPTGVGANPDAIYPSPYI